MRMDRFSSEPALVVIPLVSLKVPSCGIVFGLRFLFLRPRPSKRNAIGLRLGLSGGAFFRFACAPQIQHISHERDVYVHPMEAKRSSTETA
jgi:hypothetical protein